jgi:hypothetical protein
MTHLLIHLVQELFICEPVHSRWMYPMERYMESFKDFVRTYSKPEGNMAEGFTMEDTSALHTFMKVMRYKLPSYRVITITSLFTPPTLHWLKINCTFNLFKKRLLTKSKLVYNFGIWSTSMIRTLFFIPLVSKYFVVFKSMIHLQTLLECAPCCITNANSLSSFTLLASSFSLFFAI